MKTKQEILHYIVREYSYLIDFQSYLLNQIDMERIISNCVDLSKVLYETSIKLSLLKEILNYIKKEEK